MSKYASGGWISEIAAREDLIPAYLSPGECRMTSDAVKYYGPQLLAMLNLSAYLDDQAIVISEL